MNDRELLELAAKAAGYKVYGNGKLFRIWKDSNVEWVDWNPLEDDGDALRLAVKIYMFDGSLFDLFLKFRLEEVLNDSGRSDEEIVRRAIVRAASYIGGKL